MKNKEALEPSAIDITRTQELLMTVLKSRDLYGLEIASAIAEATEGQRKIPVGSLYPILRRLEKKGLVKSSWGDEKSERRAGARRRYYRLTGLGESTLDSAQQERFAVGNWQPA